MKTTIDLPDALLHEAKIAAARKQTTLKALVEQGLKHILHGNPVNPTSPSTFDTDGDFFETDAYQVPIIKSRGVTVTDDWIRGIREEEGI